MSCWRNYTNNVLTNVDKDNFGSAVREMGLGIDWDNKEVHAVYEGRKEACDGVFTRDGIPLSLGVRIDPTTKVATIMGDFWGTGINEKEFSDTLGQTYQKIDIIQRLEMNGYTVSNVEKLKNGEIVVEAFMA